MEKKLNDTQEYILSVLNSVIKASVYIFDAMVLIYFDIYTCI